jgi:hypothetical protein
MPNVRKYLNKNPRRQHIQRQIIRKLQNNPIIIANLSKINNKNLQFLY